MPLPLSLSIIARDEEANIARCLASAEGLAAEIIVVDSGSKDRTREIAEGFGARVTHQDWLGQSGQKQVALNLCTQPWVLSLDCDEELSPELRRKHRAVLSRWILGKILWRLVQPQGLVPGTMDHARRLVSGPQAPALPPGQGPVRRNRGARQDRGGRRDAVPCGRPASLFVSIRQSLHRKDQPLCRCLPRAAGRGGKVLVAVRQSLASDLAVFSRLHPAPGISRWFSGPVDCRGDGLFHFRALQPEIRGGEKTKVARESRRGNILLIVAASPRDRGTREETRELL